jgi:acetyl esterase/lipase
MNEPINLWPGVAPGSEAWTQQEARFTSDAGDVFLRNVVTPTLTPYLPEAGNVLGSAVVVAPGGGCHCLAWTHEGTDVAEWLAGQGVAAFLLKYRLVDTGPTHEDFLAWVESWRAGLSDEFGNYHQVDGSEEAAPGFSKIVNSDGLRAIQIVRERAGEWGIDPDRIVFLGFSAGAFIATAVATHSETSLRPNFVAPIYGGSPIGLDERGAPPLFCVVAADDGLCLDTSVATFQAWNSFGYSAELHVYAEGSHGFGFTETGFSVDTWRDRLGDWMASR